MKKPLIGNHWKIERIEWAVLPGKRARSAGSNARLGPHGSNVPLPVARITIEGETGFGWSIISKEEAEALMDVPVRELFADNGTIKPPYRKIEFPLLDWLGKIQHKPVYELFAKRPIPDRFRLSIPCYDTSLYFDDLHLTSDAEAVQLIQREAAEGKERGHTNFKIKVGRGAKHMPVEKGTRRDISIIKGVRQIAGQDGKIMIDANNGYNLNLAKEVLLQTAEDRLFWIEEAFHEDPVLYKDLKEWMQEQELNVLISDGEGVAAPPLVEWAKQGLIDVLQYDIRNPGFSFWIELGPELDTYGIKTAPHNYGSSYGNFVTGHLALAVDGLLFVEWDEVRVTGLDSSDYRIEQGYVQIPEKPGFGLSLDEAIFTKQLGKEGWSLARKKVN